MIDVPLLSPGATCYQVTIQLPGGRVICCGATGWRRDWVRQDMAGLFGCDQRHVSVRKLPAKRRR